MAGETISTNMGMPVPGVGVTAGPQWATDVVNSLNIIDAHDHSAGSGVRITPDGLNISSDLSFQTTSSATNIYKAAFSSQAAALSGTNFLSFISGNLYVNDGSGNQIAVTSAGGVAGSPGSIGSLTSPASATYTAGSKLFTWLADSGKSAAMDNGAVTIRETNVASSNGVTLAAPASLAADYQITFLTALPASTQLVNISSSGQLANISYDGVGSAMTATGANAIAATMTATGANAVANTRTRATGTTVAVGGVAISALISAYSNATTSYTDIAQITITTAGRPVEIFLRPALGALGNSQVTVSATTGNIPDAQFRVVRGATSVGVVQLGTHELPASAGIIGVPSSSLAWNDEVVAGTYTYKIQAKAGNANSTVTMDVCNLWAAEM